MYNGSYNVKYCCGVIFMVCRSLLSFYSDKIEANRCGDFSEYMAQNHSPVCAYLDFKPFQNLYVYCSLYFSCSISILDSKKSELWFFASGLIIGEKEII